jgi:PKD repeat protein
MTPDGTSNGTANNINVGTSAPLASFSYSPSSPTPGAAVTFDGSGSSSSGSITSYSWDFGDGGKGSGRTTSHAFGAATYTVRLAVKDNNGWTSVTTRMVTVTSPPPPPPPPPPSKCHVPNVKGKTLAKARGALKAKGCAVGKLIKPKHKPKGSAGKHKKWALVVKSESPRIGSTKPKGTKVKLTLIWKKVRK